MRQIDRTVLRVRPFALVVEDVKVVARHAAHHFGPVRNKLGPQCVRQGFNVVAQCARFASGGIHAPQFQQAAIRAPCRDAQHVMHHVAVGDAAAAARVVTRHAAQRGLCAGGHIYRVPQAVLFERSVQVVEHDAGLDLCAALLHIDVQNIAHGLGMVDHQSSTDGLSALAGTAAARNHGHFQVAANGQRGFYLVRSTRHKNTHRHDLVNRRIGGVAAFVSI